MISIETPKGIPPTVLNRVIGRTPEALRKKLQDKLRGKFLEKTYGYFYFVEIRMALREEPLKGLMEELPMQLLDKLRKQLLEDLRRLGFSEGLWKKIFEATLEECYP